MIEWISQLLETANSSFIIFPALLLLGLVSSVGSFCNVAAIGAIAGFAGTSKNHRRLDSLFAAIAFFLGTVLSLSIIGLIIGYAGSIATESFGRYGKALAGLVSVFFGLVALNLLPIKLPKFNQVKLENNKGLLGVIIFGFALGAASLACCLSCCAPVLPVLFGVAVLQGETLKSALIMGFFAIGYTIPLAILLMGISFGTWKLRASKITSVINIIAGLLLLAVGFYFLGTI